MLEKRNAMTLDYEKIGANIRAIRTERRISQLKVSEYTHLSTTHVSHIESGKTKVSLQALADIAEALDTTLDTLIYGNPVSQKAEPDEEVTALFSDCSSKEREVLLESLRQIKKALRQEL